MLWRHLQHQFGGGPAIARWVEFGDGLVFEVGEHNAIKVSNHSTGDEATLYVPGEILYSKFLPIAKKALGIASDSQLVLCDAEGDDMDAAAATRDSGATLYDVGYMVRLCRPA